MFFIPWLISSFIIVVELFVGFYLVFLKKKRNKHVGVRIRYAYSSEETWLYVNHFVGIVFAFIGVIEALVIYPIYACLLSSYFVPVTLIVCSSQGAILILAIIVLLIIFNVKEKNGKLK